MVKDSCYYKAKRTFAVFPSARASQWIAKCRKSSGNVRKGEAGKSLRRWGKEKWVNTKTGRPCGNKKDKSEYCRPTKKVSKETPTTRGALTKEEKVKRERQKSAGKRASKA